MRVASFNIYNGAPDTYPLIKDFVVANDIDVLCLQEANGWLDGDSPRIEEFADTTGLRFSAFGGNREHKLITFSSLPIVDFEFYSREFWHGAVKSMLDVDGVIVPVTNAHLNPFNEDDRLREATFLAHVAGDSIIGMDANSLSRADRYPRSLLKEFVTEGNQRYGVTSFRYETADYFSQQGLIDAAVALKKLENTFPARTDTEPNPKNMRLDRIYIPPRLFDAVTDIEVVKDDITSAISDHFPVVLNLRRPVLRDMLASQPTVTTTAVAL